jgi:hypothetical protein
LRGRIGIYINPKDVLFPLLIPPQCAAELWGNPLLQHKQYWKYWKATAYFNCDLEKDIIEHTIPPQLRTGLMANIPVPWRKEVSEASFSWLAYAKLYARVEALRPQLYKGFDLQENKWKQKFSTIGKGIPNAELPELSDRDLRKYQNRMLDLEDEYTRDLWTWFFINARDMLTLLGVLLNMWYDPEDTTAFQAILTGTPRSSATMKQNHMLWQLSQLIHKSATLTEIFREHKDAAFFDACKNSDSEDCRNFLKLYVEFIDLYGQRGMPDRDIYFPRRCEDPSIDYLSLQSMLKTPNAGDPEVKEHETNRKREEFADKVVAKISRSIFGLFKAELFKIVLGWCIEFVIVRDDERHYLDHATLSIRFGFMEIARRLVKYGIFETVDDVWFLTKNELYAVWDKGVMTPLTRAKINGRRRDFDKMLKREGELPHYLVNNAGIDLDAVEVNAEGVHKGTGTAKGTITARARVVRQLKDVGKVEQGEILIVNSTGKSFPNPFPRAC